MEPSCFFIPSGFGRCICPLKSRYESSNSLRRRLAFAPGRIELVAGRGSSPITFTIFDFDEDQYDRLFSSKLDLLLELNRNERVTWNGPHRRKPLRDVLIVPRPEQPLRIWLGSGGSPESVRRAVQLGLPLFLGILGGSPTHWAQYGKACRSAWEQFHGAKEGADIAVGVHGFIGKDGRQAKATYLSYEGRMFQAGGEESGRSRPISPERARDLEPGGMVFAGEPDEVADRVLQLREVLGHSRQVLQMDAGGMPQATFLKSIELLGTKVLPQVRKVIGDTERYNKTRSFPMRAMTSNPIQVQWEQAHQPHQRAQLTKPQRRLLRSSNRRGHWSMHARSEE